MSCYPLPIFSTAGIGTKRDRPVSDWRRNVSPFRHMVVRKTVKAANSGNVRRPTMASSSFIRFLSLFLLLALGACWDLGDQLSTLQQPYIGDQLSTLPDLAEEPLVLPTARRKLTNNADPQLFESLETGPPILQGSTYSFGQIAPASPYQLVVVVKCDQCRKGQDWLVTNRVQVVAQSPAAVYSTFCTLPATLRKIPTSFTINVAVNFPAGSNLTYYGRFELGWYNTQAPTQNGTFEFYLNATGNVSVPYVVQGAGGVPSVTTNNAIVYTDANPLDFGLKAIGVSASSGTLSTVPFIDCTNCNFKNGPFLKVFTIVSNNSVFTIQSETSFTIKIDNNKQIKDLLIFATPTQAGTAYGQIAIMYGSYSGSLVNYTFAVRVTGDPSIPVTYPPEICNFTNNSATLSGTLTPAAYPGACNDNTLPSICSSNADCRRCFKSSNPEGFQLGPACTAQASCDAVGAGWLCPTGTNCILPDVIPTPKTNLPCLDTEYSSRFGSSPACTENLLKLDYVVDAIDTGSCDYPGDATTISVTARLRVLEFPLFDIGVYVATDGGNARSGSCKRFPLALPPLTTWKQPYQGLTTQLERMPLENVNHEWDARDCCGDILLGRETVTVLQNIQVVCQTGLTPQYLDLGVCYSWDKSETPRTDPGFCRSVDHLFPKLSSYCLCERWPGIPVAIAARLTYRVVVDPSVPTTPTDYPCFTLNGDSNS
eukprot:g76368.t1